ncbi:MAG: VCBS repeat-containing protein [Anaerolineales bacterium]|nr:VCBS repeat-containing protein [Anaerolineales bacterium]MCB8959395.1 VCBS repeat-containing protein [Ardenticatenales bacterium]
MFLLLPLVLLGGETRAEEGFDNPNGGDILFWRDLPGGNCPGGGDNCHRGSPALADVNNDGKLDIVLTTGNGHIMAIRHNGSASGAVIFDVDIAPMIGMSSGSAVIASGAAVADIDKDGRVEIVVGYGADWNHNTKGGIIVLEHNGTLKPGWPNESIGKNNNDLPHSVFSSPALGDLDNDGDLEIVAGGFDKRIYAYHHNGNLMSGWTADSALLHRFPTWPNLVGSLADSTWSSPALADLNNDGYLDIIIGSDEGNFDSRWGGNSGGWNCPYQLPAGWAPGYCGGSVYAFDRFGNVLPGFPKYMLEAIQSTPAIADLNGDGNEDILIGTGTFYNTNSPSHPTNGFILSAVSASGGTVPGWATPKSVDGTIPGSPAIGNIAGDASPEVVIMSHNGGRIYAYHANGQLVAGFPMRPLARTGQSTNFDVGFGVILADYDNDGKMEIFVSQRDSITVVDGNGTQLTTKNNGADGKPAYATGGWLRNSPAVGDVDGDGKLELVVHDSRLYVYDLPNAGSEAEWGMFKQNAAGTSRVNAPGSLQQMPGELRMVRSLQNSNFGSGAMAVVNAGDLPMNYTVNTNNANSRVTVVNGSGQVPGNGSKTFTVEVRNVNTLNNGWNNLGTISIQATNSLGQPAGTATITLRIYRGNPHRTFLPISPSN